MFILFQFEHSLKHGGGDLECASAQIMISENKHKNEILISEKSKV